ncbi:ABC transporter substrate-binding protein [Corynebacterium bovis]|nr:ABC transporter substrate-binding protein [Corynebacterium bovis]MDH2455890.1 ABC transporter substrate-binding protein [Corynebacterium bovis]
MLSPHPLRRRPRRPRRAHRPWRRPAAAVVALATAVGLTACVTNREEGNPAGWTEILPATDPALAALVPPDIAARGRITASTNPPFAPNEFKDSDGRIIGYEIDLIRAAASLLGLEVDIRQQDFNLILPSITGGTVDVGTSGFTDTPERRKSFDFVDYYTSGIAWASRPGVTVDPADACGATVAVQQGTYSDTDDVRVKSDACEAAGRPAIHKLVYDTSDGAAIAALLGRADAVSADAPVVAYAVARSDGKLERRGDMFDTAPYGWAVAKDSPLGPALAAALQTLVDSGDYRRILAPWGLTDGALDRVTVNAEPFTAPRKAGT